MMRVALDDTTVYATVFHAHALYALCHGGSAYEWTASFPYDAAKSDVIMANLAFVRSMFYYSCATGQLI